MSAYHGPQGSGAARRRREQKRVQADTRNALTAPERRSRKSSPLAATGSAGERVTPVVPAVVGGQPEYTNPTTGRTHQP